jgi:hypothetical protein
MFDWFRSVSLCLGLGALIASGGANAADVHHYTFGYDQPHTTD